ncbi:hypothetical protein HPB48_024545 [Haemaphysalis longicornis]|uniref:L27 domain-containing protein n=1 Tax=Haemaphysalis longicornis TaxID=44386 RepID=A0A9J6H8C3_HAELO|nr:hypothetical protein HPB48_024545 [Haemaphysalis longicornis]
MASHLPQLRRFLRVNGAEAHRALELLEEYHSRLSKPQDKQLRNAIERVIRIFKSRLFQALLGGFPLSSFSRPDSPFLSDVLTRCADIQEFYEITLLDDSKSIQQKTAETLQIACKWENSPPITGTHSNSTERYHPTLAAQNGDDDEPVAHAEIQKSLVMVVAMANLAGDDCAAALSIITVILISWASM